MTLTNALAELTIRPAADCRWDLVILGEVMLRLDPGDGRIKCRPMDRAWLARIGAPAAAPRAPRSPSELVEELHRSVVGVPVLPDTLPPPGSDEGSPQLGGASVLPVPQKQVRWPSGLRTLERVYHRESYSAPCSRSPSARPPLAPTSAALAIA